MIGPARLVLATLALLAAAPGRAADDNDPRLLQFDGLQQGIFHVPTSQEATQVVLFAPGERVQSVIVSDPRAYSINVASDGESLALKAVSPSALAMLLVRTDRRSYDLELAPAAPGGRVPPVVRFVTLAGMAAQAQRPSVPEPVQAEAASWRLSGDKAVLPELVRDNGAKTFIRWKDDQAMPAVFAIGPSGKEETVDGFMRGGLFTIDRVHPQLVFRIDRVSAKAKRMINRGRNERN